MSSMKEFVGRVRGDQLAALTDEVARLTNEVAALQRAVLDANHTVRQLYEQSQAQEQTLMELNHDVRSGAEEGLPLFLGYAERLRLDADTAIGAVAVVERQLTLLEDLQAGPQDAGAGDEAGGDDA